MAPMEGKEKGSKSKGGKPKEEPSEQLLIEDTLDPSHGNGKFYYSTGATYEGEWIINAAPDPNEEAKAELEAKNSEKGSKGKVKGEKISKDDKKKGDGKTPPKSANKKEAPKDIKQEEGNTIVEGGSPPPEQPRPNRFRHGKGVYVDGEYQYEGDWKDDQICGQGTFKYASGATYEGNWQMNKYFGQGEYKWGDGRSYKGDWIENKMHGMGVYTDQSGRQYVGHFFNGIGPGISCEIK